MARRPLIAGNWKMNGDRASIAEIEALVSGLATRAAATAHLDCALCPPATLIMAAAEKAAGGALSIGGQDAHSAASGAHTGDVSAEMMADAGAKLIILGHSERRADHGESDALVRSKIEATWRAGLSAILCVGETEADRDAGRAVAVTLEQMTGSLPDGADASRLAVAYEPVWAIGSGRTPSINDIAEMHTALRGALETRIGAEGAQTRLLYGGSVKPGNAAEIFDADNVDGALVGGASLKAADFLAIIDAAAARRA